MANAAQLDIIREGPGAWNEWRRRYPDDEIDLRGASLKGHYLSAVDLEGADLRGVDFSGSWTTSYEDLDAELTEAEFMDHMNDLFVAYMSGPPIDASGRGADLGAAQLARADLRGANLSAAILRGANLSSASLVRAHLLAADLTGADLRGANLAEANLVRADLSGANLRGATLERALLVHTRLTGSTLTNARVFGASVWKVEPAADDGQLDLRITPQDEPEITVDDLDLAQFMYLVLGNEKLRRVIDTLTSKVVLILGRFTAERKLVLDALRNELRKHNLTPVLFDFNLPADRDITETVTLLARMARFIVADLTDPASIPLELQAIVPDVAVPVRCIIRKGDEPFSMFRTLKKYHWLLPPLEYTDVGDLLSVLESDVIAPAEAKCAELRNPDYA